MKGRLVKAEYVFANDKETSFVGYFAVNCEQFPEHIDDLVVFYFEDDAELEEAKSDRYKDDFRIIRIIG